MSISSVNNQQTQPVQSRPAAPPPEVDRPNDGDADDGVRATQQPAAQVQSVNTSGQLVGQVINVTA